MLKSRKILITFLIMFFPVLFIIKNSDTLISNSIKNNDKLEGNDEIIDSENWELSLVFYDSTVNNGLTPLTEINWDASDGSYFLGERRTVTMQINYKNTNTTKDYSKDNLKITIPELTANDSKLVISKAIGANTTGSDWSSGQVNSGYDWNANITNDHNIIITNNVAIQAQTNFEGSIRIVYSLTPETEKEKVEVGEDECLHTLNTTFKARLFNNNSDNLLAISDDIAFNYRRLYSHQWTKYQYELTKTAETGATLDNIENVTDYIWVNYKFTTKDKEYSNQINTVLYTENNTNYVIEDELPAGAVAYVNGIKQEPFEGNKYRFSYPINKRCCSTALSMETKTFYATVGYPKAIYNEENNNMHVSNTASLYITYEGETELSYQQDATVELDLNDFLTLGNLYSTKKSVTGNYIPPSENMVGGISYKRYYQAIKGEDDSLTNGNLFAYEIKNEVKYSGKPITIEVGDDFLYYTNQSPSSSNKIKLEDNDYYFNTIRIPRITNAYNESIYEKYNWKLYVRDANSTTYRLYREHLKNENITFAESEKIVAAYIKADDITETIKFSLYVYINFIKYDIPEYGYLYNSSYQKVYFKENNELILQNPGTVPTYDELANHDIEKHGAYLQRSTTYDTWEKFSLLPPKANYSTGIQQKYHSQIIQDDENKIFRIEFYEYAHLTSSNSASASYNEAHKADYDPVTHTLKTMTYYTIIPKGMKVGSTKQQIINDIEAVLLSVGNGYGLILDTNFEPFEDDELTELIHATMTEDDITITENWRGTGKTLLKIVVPFGEEGVYLFSTSSYCQLELQLFFDAIVTYDDYEEYGNLYELELYEQAHNSIISPLSISRSRDALDIDNDNDNSEYLGYSKTSVSLLSAISTHQDLQTAVETDLNNFNTKTASSSFGANYTYKLRARTGESNVTNLVIYDSIEDYAKDHNLEMIKAAGKHDSWRGEFLGVDTSYAEEKGYQVKVYYNENPLPGRLKEDNTWHAYNDSVDKSLVKSLAFEFLDSNGNPALVPANTVNYVLIKMKAPTTEYKHFTYNGCWVDWNAIDPLTGKSVDFITGINSNIVRIGIPSSTDEEASLVETITIEKIWKDNNNALGLRPNSVKFYIVPNDNYNKRIEVNLTGEGNVWTTNVEVPKYDTGEEINYKIVEDPNVSNIINEEYKYVSSVEGNTYTNTLHQAFFFVKYWRDNNNAYLTRPSSLDAKIYKDGEYYKDITFTGDYNHVGWSQYVYLPVFNEENEFASYTLAEEDVPGYISSCTSYYCNNLLSATKKIIVHKVWKDKSNAYNTRPSSVSIILKRNNSTYRTITLSGAGDTWDSEEIEVPVYDNNGVKYNYNIEENTLASYGSVLYNQDTYTVTNTLKETKSITITKKWIDNNNAYNTRPSELIITLLQNGKDYQVLKLTGTTNIWSQTLEVPKYDDNQEEYIYSIKESNDSINPDYSEITYSESDLSVTNQLKKNKTISISKVWNDYDNKYLTRPESINVMLLQNGSNYQKIALTGTTSIWNNNLEVPVYDNNGKKYLYTIKEIEGIDKYGEIKYDQTTLTITNKLTEIPSVSLYFTVTVGYINPVTGELSYDKEGFNKILMEHNIDPDSDYEFKIKLQNIGTEKTYEGKLTSSKILEFKDLPYGEYRAVEDKDNLFEFVSMESIAEVPGVEFIPGLNGGTIAIKPTGSNIIYGANIINRINTRSISDELENPNTGSKIVITMIVLILSLLTAFIFKYKINKLN